MPPLNIYWGSKSAKFGLDFRPQSPLILVWKSRKITEMQNVLGSLMIVLCTEQGRSQDFRFGWAEVHCPLLNLMPPYHFLPFGNLTLLILFLPHPSVPGPC